MKIIDTWKEAISEINEDLDEVLLSLSDEDQRVLQQLSSGVETLTAYR